MPARGCSRRASRARLRMSSSRRRPGSTDRLIKSLKMGPGLRRDDNWNRGAMFELTFLGTAATTPSPERGLSALLVGAGSERFLVDCGEGTQRQLLRAGAGFRRLRHVLLTHAHLDHVLGLAGLIATLGLFDQRGEMT